MKKKLKLSELQVKSFTTSNDQSAIKGGLLGTIGAPCTLGIQCIPSYTCAESRPPAMCYPQ